MTRADDLATLGLASGATEPEIRTAYRAMALNHHPDLGGDPNVMATISNAYERLLDRGASGQRLVDERVAHQRPTAASAPSVRQDWAVDSDDAPDDFTIGHSMLAFVVVPLILAVILFLGVFSVLSTIL